MEEKERYEVISPNLNGYAYIHDFKTDDVLNTYDSCDLLNQQSKRIKELEEETQQLKQQLHELPKKIVVDIRDVLNGNDVEIQDNIYLTDILDTIVKKYGGEDESLCCNVKQ